jgi:hypothetical protein
MIQKLCELCGWLGMVFIQGATLPTTIGILMGTNPRLPEISLILMVWSGLALYFIRAVAKKDTLHICSNGLGFFLQSSLLALIVFGG